MKLTAPIVEIFSSLQGEGLYTGEPTIFVRFAHCRLGCSWCDTRYALCEEHVCRVTMPDGLTVAEVPNPISATALNEIVESYEARMVSVTGGEPLGHAEFLAEWLPSIVQRRTILLETNGTLPDALAKVAGHIHIVSMDFKLPSSAGCPPQWQAHEAFLKTALKAGREVYVKIVVTERTTDQDMQEAIRIITRINKYVPVIIQPASQTLTFHDVISRRRLDSIDRLCRAYLPDVRVALQMHKQWGVQ